MKPHITREPGSVKGWCCRSKDGAFGFGEDPNAAFWDWFFKASPRDLLLGGKWVSRDDPLAVAAINAFREVPRSSAWLRL